MSIFRKDERNERERDEKKKLFHGKKLSYFPSALPPPLYPSHASFACSMKYGILFRFPLHIIIIIQEIKVRARPGKISSKRVNVNDDDDDGGTKKKPE